VATSKKSKSKPAAKKAVRKPQLLAPEFDNRLINGIAARVNGIAARVEQLAADLKAANQKLDYVVDNVIAHQRADEETNPPEG
jgi:outer membrane murein-binding lipoprotein Lpp